MNDYYAQGGTPSSDYEFYLLRKQAERRKLRLLGLYIGGAILLYVLLQNVLTLPLAFPNVRTQYEGNALLRNGVDLLVIMASMLPPFLLLSKSMGRVSGCWQPLPLEKPQGDADVLLMIPVGLMFCMVANRLTDLLVSTLLGFGVELSAPEMPLPRGVFGVVAAVFRVVIMPAVVEELCFRGVVMQHLRSFGNRFAVVTAALCFALLHCNLVQAPFAFIVGLVLGYFVIQTGSLWPAIIIHALNNAVSLAFSYLSESYSAEFVNLAYVTIQGTLFGCGAVCFLVYLYRRRENARLPREGGSHCTFGEKCRALFSAPTMLLAVGVMLYFTSRYVGLT